jgi:mycoredoxin
MTATPTAPVTMYTTDWCGYCVRLKKLMQRDGIEFAEVNIEHDAAAAELVMQANGGNRTVPTLLVPGPLRGPCAPRRTGTARGRSRSR